MKKYFILFLLCFVTAQISAFNPLVPVQTQIHEVYSAADGRKLLNDVFVNRSYTLDTTGWTHGTYVVRMVCGEEVFAEKFVIQ